jgi:thiosulfate reductase cytochrome b subunit
MRSFWVLKGLRVLVFVGLAVAAFGYAVMTLWNWLLPPLTGWHALGFPQALGLLVLCRILFGRLGGRGGHWRARFQARMDAMTPEERERFRTGLRRRCHPGADRAPPAAA